MTQLVQVEQVYADGYARVFVRRAGACGGDCHSCGGCGGARVYVRAKNTLGAQPGERVYITSQTAQVLSAVAVVCLLPLAALLAGYFAGLALGVFPGVSCAAGFGLSLGLILLYHRFVQKKRPVTYEITSRAEA